MGLGLEVCPQDEVGHELTRRHSGWVKVKLATGGCSNPTNRLTSIHAYSHMELSPSTGLLKIRRDPVSKLKVAIPPNFD